MSKNEMERDGLHRAELFVCGYVSGSISQTNEMVLLHPHGFLKYGRILSKVIAADWK